MTSRLITGLLLLSCAGVSAAHATSLGGATSPPTAAGKTLVSRCDTAVTVTYATTGGLLSSATVTGIADPACEGGTARIAIQNAGGVMLAQSNPVTIPVDGDTAANQVTLPLSPATVNPDLLASYDVVITGP